MAEHNDRRESLAKLFRCVAGVAVGLVGVAVFLTVFFVGSYWPRKNAARHIRDRGRMVMAMLPAATADSDRARLQEAVDCAVRAVWTDSLPREEALPVADVCLTAISDGKLSADEVAALTAQAEALCRRGGGPPRR